MLHSERLDCVVHALLYLELKSNLSFCQLLLILAFLFDQVLPLLISIPCYPQHARSNLLENSACPIFLVAHLLILLCPAIKEVLQMSLECVGH